MMNPRQQMIRRIVDKHEEEIRGLAGAVADEEQKTREKVRTICEAAGVDPEEVGAPSTVPIEERIDQLVAMMEARMASNPWALYVAQLAPEELEKPERAAQYAGIDSEAWESQIAAWAESYREATGAEGYEDRALAAEHVRTVFGVDMETFEEEIVGWTAADTYETVFRGPSRRSRDALGRLADRL